MNEIQEQTGRNQYPCSRGPSASHSDYYPAMKNPVQIFSKVDYTFGDWKHSSGICQEEWVGFSPMQQMERKNYSEFKNKRMKRWKPCEYKERRTTWVEFSLFLSVWSLCAIFIQKLICHWMVKVNVFFSPPVPPVRVLFISPMKIKLG